MSKRSHISYFPEVIKFDSRDSYYKTDEYIAKSFDQVGRHISNDAIVNNDINILPYKATVKDINTIIISFIQFTFFIF